MPRQDTTDFLTAFAVGTVLGIGATLLLRPGPRTAKGRLLRDLKPYRKEMKRSLEEARAAVRRGAGATGEITDDAIDAGRELLSEFRDEVRRILDETRDELKELARESARGARKGGGGSRARGTARRPERAEK